MSSFTHIRTSKDNHTRVVELTRKFGFGAENVAARVALAASLASGKRMELSLIQNSAGKEYRTTVLFGKHLDAYVSMIAVKYSLHKTDKDVPKLIKMHIDDGLEQIDQHLRENLAGEGLGFIIERIEQGLAIMH